MRFWLLLLLLAAVLVPGATAQSLTIHQATVSAPEMGTLKILELNYGGERFKIVPPIDWRVEMDSDGKGVRFISSSNIVLAITFSSENAAPLLTNTETLRRRVAPQLTDATLAGEFPAYGGNSQGKGVELEYTGRSRKMICRGAVIPLPHGNVSFSITSAADEARFAQQVFGAALTSFQRASEVTSSR